MRQSFQKIGWQEARHVWRAPEACRPENTPQTSVELHAKVVEHAQANIKDDADSKAALEAVKAAPAARTAVIKMTCGQLDTLLADVKATIGEDQKLSSEEAGEINNRVATEIDARRTQPDTTEITSDAGQKAKAELAKPRDVPSWYKPDAPIDPTIQKNVNDKDSQAGLAATIQRLQKLGVTLAPEQMSAALIKVSSARAVNDPGTLLGNRTYPETQKLGDQIKQNGETLIGFFEKEYPAADAPGAAKEFAKAKGLDLGSAQALTEYLAFSTKDDIVRDLKNGQTYIAELSKARVEKGTGTGIAANNTKPEDAQKAAEAKITAEKAKDPLTELQKIAEEKGPLAAIISLVTMLFSNDKTQAIALFNTVEQYIGADKYAKIKKEMPLVADLDPRGKDEKGRAQSETVARTIEGLKKVPGLDLTSDELAALRNNKALSLTAVMAFKEGAAEKLGDVPAAKVLALQKFITENGARAGLDTANDANKTKPVLIALTHFQPQLFPQETQTAATNTTPTATADTQKPAAQQPTQNG